MVQKLEKDLNPLFAPKTVAVIGAKDTHGSVGRTVVSNLIDGGGVQNIVPVNPNRVEVCGLPCFKSVELSPWPVDLAVIVVPAKNVPDVMSTCAAAGVKAVIVISAGFKESGAEGQMLETVVAKIAKDAQIRMVGPNCLGIMNPHMGINASFARGMPLKGSTAFISQSGAMCAAVLDWSLEEGVGFSSFVSIGSMADVGWADLIEYFGKDPLTRGILMYMETVGNPQAFLAAARKVICNKPIIVIRPGRTPEAARAAASHTGALVGSDAVFDAACERVGILRVNTVSDLFDMAELLSGGPRLKGPRLAVVTNAGGPGVLATDAAVEKGIQMAQLSDETMKELSALLPSAWSHSNPVDILGDACPDRYSQAVTIVAHDPQVDGVVAILTPQAMTDPTKTAEQLRQLSKGAKKPIIACWMGGRAVFEGRQLLLSSGVPCFDYPDEAAERFASIWKRETLLKSMQEHERQRPILLEQQVKERITKAKELINNALFEKKSFLSERESKQLLQLYGIPVVETFLAADGDAAASIADRMGYPVVLKLESASISHKSDVGGVVLGLTDATSVRSAYETMKERIIHEYGVEAFGGITVQKMVSRDGVEIIIGSSIDPQFGPTLLFGAGGIYVEAYKDLSLGLPPLSTVFAKKMILSTKVATVLAKPRREDPIPLEPIEDILIALSELVLELPDVIECDMNPILASSSGVFCLDARIVISSKNPPVPPAMQN